MIAEIEAIVVAALVVVVEEKLSALAAVDRTKAWFH